MANFHNPYMQSPDWGAGISNMFNQIMQLKLFNQMFPKSAVETEDLGQTQLPPSGFGGQNVLGQVGAQNFQLPQNQFQMPQMPPQGQQFSLAQNPFSQLMQMFQSQMGGQQGSPYGQGGF